uniref:SAM domain-containing protein n=1 Tax=Callorhinchus milii TaxID=7868 RepID=A0A4W3HWR0_CALMI|eukprot:gi/632967041/ref/XP_007899752.1/ PREDICTED: sterile alpha motif domain-containing protein 14 [Callorhinchus milii]
MSTTKATDTDEVFDFNEVIPETERLDNSLQKARAQLSVKARRQRPSRSRLRDSISSTEGDESLERKASDSYGSPLHNMRSPLHSSLRGSSPSSESVLSSASPSCRSSAFLFDVNIMRRTYEDGDHTRDQTLTDVSSQETLGLTPASSPSKSCHSSDTSPIHTRRDRRAEKHSEGSGDSKETSPGEPGSPVVGLDKKAKRKFLDLGAQLRRSSSTKGRRGDKAANRLSTGSRESIETSVSILASAKSAVPQFAPFSWFTDSSKGSTSSSGTMSPTCSPRASSQGFPSQKSASQDSTLSNESSPRSGSPKILSSSIAESRGTPTHTLSLSSDECLDEGQTYCLVSSWTTQQVSQWLRGLNMDQYSSEFTAGNIDGEQLLRLDGSKLKALGVVNSQDRSLLKKKLRDVNAAVERERKTLEKLEKQKEKQKKKEQEQSQKKCSDGNVDGRTFQMQFPGEGLAADQQESQRRELNSR